MSLVVRTLTATDVEVAAAIAEAAYGGPRERRSELARYVSLQPEGWMLAVRGGTPAGLGGAIDYGPFAYIGLMAVHPSLQRQGIAQAIVEHLLAWIQAQGCPMILLDASAMGQPLYAKLGFIEDDNVVVFVRDSAPTVHPAAPQVSLAGAEDIATRLLAGRGYAVSHARAEDVPDLVAFDTPIFGARRDRVLASYLADDPSRAFLTRDADGTIGGYLVAQEHTLGPWVAQTPRDAEALLAHAVALPYETPPQVLVPAANRQASGMLERYGFTAQRTLSHMRLGGTRSPTQRDLIYGQTSFALG